MPWTNPPTFADGNVLSAAQLNILTEDILYLKGIAAAINSPTALAYSVQNAVFRYLIRHKQRYLHFRYHIGHDPASHVWLRYGGVEIYDLNNPPEGTVTLIFDLDTETPGIAYGDVVTIEIEYHGDINSDFELHYLWESDSAT